MEMNTYKKTWRQLLLSAVTFFTCQSSLAQIPSEGMSYYLPQTEMVFTFLVEKTSFTPGELAEYAQRYLKARDAGTAPLTTYRIVDIKMNTIGRPDTTKHFTLALDKRFSISELHRTDYGVLTAINTTNPYQEPEAIPFQPAAKPKPLNPRDYMNEDILTATSKAKMAQLIAQDIYDIRDSRNQLQRGLAEFMPKDGEQLRIMLNGLATQEQALSQLFVGTTEIDTTEVTLVYVPRTVTDREVFFRFSKYYGMTDADDLGGTPYYISVTQEQLVDNNSLPQDPKAMKDNINLYVNTPGKIKVSLTTDERTLKNYTFYAAQFGNIENLSGALFGKKQTSKIVLNPITGGIESITEELLK